MEKTHPPKFETVERFLKFIGDVYTQRIGDVAPILRRCIGIRSGNEGDYLVADLEHQPKPWQKEERTQHDNDPEVVIREPITDGRKGGRDFRAYLRVEPG